MTLVRAGMDKAATVVVRGEDKTAVRVSFGGEICRLCLFA